MNCPNCNYAFKDEDLLDKYVIELTTTNYIFEIECPKCDESVDMIYNFAECYC